MTRYALRVTDRYPWPGYVGDIVPIGPCTTRRDAEDVRDAMTNGGLEVVQLDDEGNVIA